MTDNQLRLVTLGRVALVLPAGRDDEGLNKQRRKLAVLAVLALARRPVARDALAEMFWGGQPEERARHSLSEALSHLRRVLGREAIATRQSDLALLPEHAPAVDALELAAAAANGDDARVIALYEGPFLDAVHLDDAPSFERWVDGERARLESLFLKACDRHAMTLARARRWEECAELAARWLDAAPLSADAARYLVNALKAPATREADARALAEYERLATRLRTEYDASPDRTVAELATDIRARLDAAASVAPVAVVAPPAAGVAPSAPAPSVAPARTSSAVAGAIRRPYARRWLALGLLAGVAGATVLWTFSRQARTSATSGAPSTIAVVPFTHLGGDTSAAYLTEGLTEEISAALGEVAGLRVMASPSIETLRARRMSARELGAALGADVVLEGSVRPVRDSARVTIRLVDTRAGTQLWAGRYDRSTRDVLAMQEDIARSVVGTLRTRSGAADPARPRRSIDPRAHDLYLRARYLENRGGEANTRRAIAYHEQALRIDSGFAGAHAGIATAELQLLQWGATYAEIAPRARGQAEAAIQLDAGSAEAHLVLARLLRTDWRWRDAEREFRVALAANPSDAGAWHSLSHLYLALGDLPRSRVATARGLALDPLNPRLVMHECIHFLVARVVDSALASCRRGLELDPGFPDSHAKLAAVHLLAGHAREAVAEVDREMALNGATPAYRATRALALAHAGARDSAVAELQAIERDTPAERIPLFACALVYARLGDRERALSRLEQAYARHDVDIEDLGTAPDLDALRSDGRFQSLLARVGLARVATP